MKRAIMTGTLLAVSPAAAQQTAPAGFCLRAAAELDMRPVAGATPPTWRKPLMGLGSALLGGSSSVGMTVQPRGEPSAADYARLQKACAAVKKGIDCTVEGPMALQVSIKGNEHVIEAQPGERAVFRMVGSRLECVESAATSG